MIPKIIHYCWFGGNPLPSSAIRCINSWKRYLPDYEIKEWNESNYDVETPPYISEAYAAKKYAFVSDYARFDILYHEGGLYFDTDVELINTIDDLISKGPFMGREAGSYIRSLFGIEHDGLAVAPGLGLCAEKGMTLYKELLDVYRNLSFINPDGSFNTKTVVVYTTEFLIRKGLDANNIEPVCIEGIWVYPADFFCPMDHTKGNLLRITSNTRAIHHYDASWLNHSPFHQFLRRIKKSIIRVLYNMKIIQ